MLGKGCSTSFFGRVGGGCGRSGSWCCQPCRGSARPVPMARCRVCHRLCAVDPCPMCQGGRAGPESMVAWFALDGPVREVIHKFKYGDRPNLAGPLVELGLRQGDLPLGVVVPVPWAANRRRHRGYNQAEALLRKIAAGTGRQQLEGLRRVRETDAQVGLGGEERGGEERAGPSRGRSLGGGGSQKRSCWWTMWSPPGPRWSNAPGLPGPRA